MFIMKNSGMTFYTWDGQIAGGNPFVTCSIWLTTHWHHNMEQPIMMHP